MTEPAAVAESEEVAEQAPAVASLLAQFNGDAEMALASALDEIQFLQRELAFASLAIGYGFARGWRPSIERPIPSEDS